MKKTLTLKGKHALTLLSIFAGAATYLEMPLPTTTTTTSLSFGVAAGTYIAGRVGSATGYHLGRKAFKSPIRQASSILAGTILGLIAGTSTGYTLSHNFALETVQKNKTKLFQPPVSEHQRTPPYLPATLSMAP